MSSNLVLGIDIGGTGIKGAPVDLKKGILVADRFRIETPKKSTPEAVAKCAKQIVEHFKWKGPVGFALPSVVQKGLVRTAANIDKSWIGKDAVKIFGKSLSRKVTVINDADAAGLAEMHYGAGKKQDGLVIMVTLGTGIGTALFFRGQLIPNSELGHLEIRGKDAERRASGKAREVNDWGWNKWGKEVDRYLDTLEALLYPDLIIIGGGVSSKAEKFFHRLSLSAHVVPAKLQNEAGIVGAALAFRET